MDERQRIDKLCAATRLIAWHLERASKDPEMEAELCEARRSLEFPGWDEPESQKYSVMTGDQFRAFLNLMMVSDPWPLKDVEHASLLDFADSEAAKRGYENWIEAYHKFGK